MEQDDLREEANLDNMEDDLEEEKYLGLCLCCPQKDKLDCGKAGGNQRGRKILAKLKLIDRYVVDETKITSMLNVGKGKILPKEI